MRVQRSLNRPIQLTPLRIAQSRTEELGLLAPLPAILETAEAFDTTIWTTLTDKLRPIWRFKLRQLAAQFLKRFGL